jgi:hypothetical protein
MEANGSGSLASLLVGQPPGRWVVLDSQMTKILGTAETPEEALVRAAVFKSSESSEDRPVMVQVPDPDTTCLY